MSSINLAHKILRKLPKNQHVLSTSSRCYNMNKGVDQQNFNMNQAQKANHRIPPQGSSDFSNAVPRSFLDLACQPCEFPPPTTRIPYKAPCKIDFSKRKLGITRRESVEAASQSGGDEENPAKVTQHFNRSSLDSIQRLKETLGNAKDQGYRQGRRY